MSGSKVIAVLMAIFLCAAAFSARGEDSVTLDDGTVLKGKYVKEENGSVYLQQPTGETAVIDKSRIRRMELTNPPPSVVAELNKKEKDKKEGSPTIGNRKSAAATVLNPAWAQPRMAELADLGAPELAKRKAILAKIKDNKDEYLLVMLAMLNPKMKTDEYVRIGILRSLIDFAPLNDDAAKTLAYAGVFDPYPEARREACRTIRLLHEDRAIRDLIVYAFAEGNPTLKQAGAIALHEIDDDRIYATIISKIPAPTVNANYGEPTGLDKPKYAIRGGPGGLSMPIWLPTQSVTGVAADIGGPFTDFLKAVARKDMGNLAYAWLIWYREKIGELGKEERDAYHDKRGVRERTNAP